MRITTQTRPFAALYRGVPVMLALFFGVLPTGERVRGLAAEYADGVRVIAVVPVGERN
jgi:hypothetical protein